MAKMNRRSFMQMSAGALLAEGAMAEAGSPPAAPQRFMRGMANSPYHAAVEKLDRMTGAMVSGWKWHADDTPHPEDPALDDSSWSVYELPAHARGEQFFQPHSVGEGPTWFRKWVQIPAAMGGYRIQGLPVRLNLRVFGGSQRPIRVFSNGSLVEMTPADTQGPILLTSQAKPGQKFLIAAYSPTPAGVFARLEVEYAAGTSNPQTMMEEILAVSAASKGFQDGQEERDAQLQAAVSAINFSALDRGDQRGFDQSLAAADDKMQPLAQWMKQFTIRAVGNSHMDMAWLWPWVETVQTVRDTLGTALELMDEYPGLYFAQSTAQYFLWLERWYPDEFKEIQKRVNDGRFEMVGGMWCEPDLNIPDGEALVRQLLTAMPYFKKKFGVDVKIGWNPDSFGYSWQLAQIYKRSGVDYFVTQKISWNDTTQFPYKLFHWEAPDGSRVLTYFPHGYGNEISPVTCAGYIAEDTPLCSGFKEQLLLYGVGDHGGGPTRQMLDAAERWKNSPNAAFPNLQYSTAQEFFDQVDANLSTLNLPVWKSELYFQYHRGVYTTQAESKRRVRESEHLMLNSEKYCSLAMLHGREYPQRIFEDCWRRLCDEEFHDQMAGSGIHVIYEDEAESIEFLRDACLPQLHDSLRLLATRADTRGQGVPVVVFNPLSWERNDVTEAEVQFPWPVAKLEVRDPQGNVVPFAEVSRQSATHVVKIRFLARAVPAMGYKVFHVFSTENPREAATTLKASGLSLENELLSLEVDPKTGCVTSLVNKKEGKNILRSTGKGNLLETFVDKPRNYDAWNINLDYEKHKWELLDAEEVKLVENTPVRAVIRVKKSFQNSSFIQEIRMYPEIARADVHMHVDWHEQHIMLKVAFPLDIRPLNATYEIPYGTIVRAAIPHVPGKPPVPFTEAKGVQSGKVPYEPLRAQEGEFEVPAQKWGDLSENGRGFSLLNAEKYGYDTVEPGTLRLTLLRSPADPDPHADQGPHDFTYSMYPHGGDWREAGTEYQGYELNYPVMPCATIPHEGLTGSSHSFVRIEPANVILTAIKRAEEDGSVVFRFYEFEGKDSQVRLTLPEAATSAVETNLMEKEERQLTLGGGAREIDVPIGHYEIKTVKVTFTNAAGLIPPRRV